MRSKWTAGESSSVLYRLENEEVSTEFLLKGNEDLTEGQPARFIFDSPLLLAGSIKPLGLFKLFELDSLISRESMKDRSTYSADRSSENPENTGGTLFWPEGGGLFFETNREMFLNGGTWLNLEPLPYFLLDYAFDFSIKEGGAGEKTGAEDWFRDSNSQPEGTLYHAGTDTRYDLSFLSVRLRTVASGGDHHLPGLSVLPEIHFIFDRAALYLRYWQNSENYRTRFMEYPDWNWQFEAEMNIYTGNKFWNFKGLMGKPRPDDTGETWLYQAYNLNWQREGRVLDWQLKGAGALEPAELFPYSLNAEGGLGLRMGHWYVKIRGDGAWEGFPLWHTARGGSLSLGHAIGGLVQNKLKTSCSIDEEGTRWIPSWEGVFSPGQWRLSVSTAWEMEEWGDPAESPFSLSVKIEWSD